MAHCLLDSGRTQDRSNILAWIRSFQGLHYFGESSSTLQLLRVLMQRSLICCLRSLKISPGLRFIGRMDMYSKMCAILVFGLLMWLFIAVIETYFKESIDYESVAMAVDVRFWVILYLVVFWGFLVAITLAIMAANNKEMRRFELLILQHRLRLRELSCMTGFRRITPARSHDICESLGTKQKDREDEASRLEEVDDLLNVAAKTIEAQLRVMPHRFLDQNGTWSLFGQYITIWFTVITISLALAGFKWTY